MIDSQWRVLKRNVLPKNGTNHNLYSSYFSVHPVKQRYLGEDRVACPFHAFFELIKCVYQLDHGKKKKKRKNTMQRSAILPNIAFASNKTNASKLPLEVSVRLHYFDGYLAVLLG